MEIVILIAKITVLVAIAGSISAAAYLCVKCQRIKTFAAVDGGYWCAAALLMIAAFYKLDPVHFIEALIAVGPLVFIPGILLLLCVSGRLTRRAVLPIAFAASPHLDYSLCLRSTAVNSPGAVDLGHYRRSQQEGYVSPVATCPSRAYCEGGRPTCRVKATLKVLAEL